ncbi:unnamed protein product [Effrenium voratum]|uniref:Pentatricopeptide repeat-containing protein-mitochondrial domain-containing protein n=1 Tax=Effrenium voratum TaxID=2562239 RepID=A0AA36J0Z7_9DINO|nr:unnamed protein product [Effrenium voratum]
MRWPLRGCSPSVEALLEEMNQHAEMGHVACAERCFQALRGQVPRWHLRLLHNTQIKACANAGQLREALMCFSRMQQEGVHASARTLGKLMSCAARGGHVSWTLRLLERLAPEVGLDAACLGSLIDALARSGRAQELSNLVEGLDLDRKAFGAAIKAFAEAGDPQQAAAWLLRMPSPDLEAFNTVLHAFARQGQVEEAEAWLRRAEEADLQPNEVSYTCVLDACAKAGDGAAAPRLLRRAQLAQVTPGAAMFGAAIDACASQGQLQEAEALLNEMQARGLPATLSSFNGLVKACSRAKKATQAEAWLQKAESAKLRPDAQMLNTVLSACAKAQDVQRCVHWLDNMQSRKVQPSAVAFTSAISACGRRAEHRQMAEEIWRRLSCAPVAPDQRLLGAVRQAYGPARAAELEKKAASAGGAGAESSSGGVYKCIHGPRVGPERVAIRSAPSATAAVLDTIHPGTLLRISEDLVPSPPESISQLSTERCWAAGRAWTMTSSGPAGAGLDRVERATRTANWPRWPKGLAPSRAVEIHRLRHEAATIRKS